MYKNVYKIFSIVSLNQWTKTYIQLLHNDRFIIVQKYTCNYSTLIILFDSQKHSINYYPLILSMSRKNIQNYFIINSLLIRQKYAYNYYPLIVTLIRENYVHKYSPLIGLSIDLFNRQKYAHKYSPLLVIFNVQKICTQIFYHQKTID